MLLVTAGACFLASAETHRLLASTALFRAGKILSQRIRWPPPASAASAPATAGISAASSLEAEAFALKELVPPHSSGATLASVTTSNAVAQSADVSACCSLSSRLGSAAGAALHRIGHLCTRTGRTAAQNASWRSIDALSTIAEQGDSALRPFPNGKRFPHTRHTDVCVCPARQPLAAWLLCSLPSPAP